MTGVMQIACNHIPGASQVVLVVKNPPANAVPQETRVWSLDREDPPGVGNGDLLQNSCLENPRDRGAWRATVREAKKWDRTEQLSSPLFPGIKLRMASTRLSHVSFSRTHSCVPILPLVITFYLSDTLPLVRPPAGYLLCEASPVSLRWTKAQLLSGSLWVVMLWVVSSEVSWAPGMLGNLCLGKSHSSLCSSGLPWCKLLRAPVMQTPPEALGKKESQAWEGKLTIACIPKASKLDPDLRLRSCLSHLELSSEVPLDI